MLLVVEHHLREAARQEDPRCYGGDVAGRQKALGAVQPGGTGHRVVVQQGDNVPASRGHAGVHARGEAFVLVQADHADVVSAPDLGRHRALRAIVDEYDLVDLITDRLEAPRQPFGRTKRDDDGRGAQVVAFSVERSMTRSMKP